MAALGLFLPGVTSSLVDLQDAAFRTQPPSHCSTRGLSIFSRRGFFVGAAWVGNEDFDPLQIATADNLVPLRHAELKHGRLAMLAALGWPAQELIHPMLVDAFRVKRNLLTVDGCSPSALNGGLHQAEILPALALTVAIGSLFEWKEWQTRSAQGLHINEWSKSSVAGDVNFDPMGLAADLPVTERFELQQAELANGRIAMLALLGFATFEAIWHVPVVSLTW